jgi:hypothetical protein
MKLTRQGVRDLSHIKGKSVGRKLELPPEQDTCKHLHVCEYGSGWIRCEDCNMTLERCQRVSLLSICLIGCMKV